MSVGFTVVYSPAARDDLRDIASYILYELKAPQAAKNVTMKLRKEIRSLSAMPNRYALVEWEPWASMKLHRVPVGNYIIFYTVDETENTVVIVRIFYVGRDIKKILQDNDL